MCEIKDNSKSTKTKLTLEYLNENYKEVKKVEVMNLLEGTVYYIFNPLTEQIREEVSSIKDIAHNKYCYEKIKFFINSRNKK